MEIQRGERIWVGRDNDWPVICEPSCPWEADGRDASGVWGRDGRSEQDAREGRP
jgi:hypothetical protein